MQLLQFYGYVTPRQTLQVSTTFRHDHGQYDHVKVCSRVSALSLRYQEAL